MAVYSDICYECCNNSIIPTYKLRHCFVQALSDVIAKIQTALPHDGRTGKRTYGSTNFLASAPSRVKAESALTTNEGGVTRAGDEKPFDNMNNIVANLLLNMTRCVANVRTCTLTRTL